MTNYTPVIVEKKPQDEKKADEGKTEEKKLGLDLKTDQGHLNNDESLNLDN
eukprot:CAMPEP_0170559314 /NCGR_PEP_ID=MMETSP0211-20121228/41860_1 /TAXON_ID=311385 /ORGANISM="Pseudokeronopsis sp., Strain OXSARD2" /LENGTH=50 /DNA_ID=CAMNT_0010872217 /DNA_START=499 /DNA_END=651 /DNA_ORIENTATION=-